MEALNGAIDYIRTLLGMYKLGLVDIPADVLELILLHLFDIDPLYVLHLSEVCKSFHSAMQKPSIAAKLKRLRKQLKKDLAMVKRNGMDLEFVKYQTPQICLAAVMQNGSALKFVQNQTKKICMVAVTQNGRALKYVKDQTEKICMVAVTQNGLALEYVKYKTRKLCNAAIYQTHQHRCSTVHGN
tara:strand:- start:51486 stop:52040 length:555 start_codon:yes stop_codon:yes gene_type:complete